MALAAPAGAEEFDLSRALADAVALPTAERRAEAAKKLAVREDVTLDALVEAAAAFGTFAEVEAGIHADVASLSVAGRVEETPLHVYVPESYDRKKPAPLLLALHGSGGVGDGQHRMWVSVAERLGMLVLAPTETVETGGYAFTRRERLATLAALRWARLRFNVDENRIAVSGISRGGHLTWDLGLRYPDRFVALAPMIGGPRWEIARGRNNLRYIENVAHVPIRDLQGWKDHPGMLFNLELAFEKLKRFAAVDARLIQFPERGHSFEFGAVDWAEFLGGVQRDPRPTRVVRACARKDEARAYWLEALKFSSKVRETFIPKIAGPRAARLDANGQRRFMAEAAEKKTARVEGRFTAEGRFEIKAKEVTRVRLLLDREMFDPEKPVLVRFNRRNVKRTVAADKAVLLAEFVERFDRTFLPVAAMTVP